MKHYLSEFIYGSIDGLITTFAIIASSVGAGIPNIYMVIICCASIIADGYSMGISRYLSYSAETKLNSSKNHIYSGIITFISFACIGVLPVLPFLFLTTHAFELSVCLTLILFLVIGFIKGKILNTTIYSSILETFSLGVSASVISYIVGYYLKNKIDI